METWTVKVLSCGVSFCRILRRHSEVDFMDIKCHHSNLWPLKSYQIILESKRTFTPNFKKLSPRHSWDIMFLVPGAATADMTAWKWTRLLFSHKKTAQLKQTIISKYLTVRSCWKLRDHKTVLSSGELHTSSNSTKRKRSSKEQLPRYWTSDSGVDLLSYIPLKVELYIQRLITD